MQGHAVHGRRHAVLAHAPVDVAARIVRDVEGRRALDEGVVRAGQVGRAADHLRDGREEVVEGRAGVLAGGRRGLGVHRRGDVGVEGLEGAGREFARHGALEIRRLRRRREPGLPGLAGAPAPPAGSAPGLHQVFRQLERRQVPAHGLARLGDLTVEEGVAVAVRVALLGPGALRDLRPAGDQGGAVLPGRPAQGGGDLAVVVTVDRLDRPAIGLEAGQLVAGLGDGRLAVDGGVVVVEQDGQPVQAEPAGNGGGLVADALHQAAVAGDHPGAVIHKVLAEAGGQVALGHGHADGGGEALAEGACGGLHPRRVAVFRVPGRVGAPLPKVADLVHRHGLEAGQVQEGVDQHGAVPCRQDEAVAVRPFRPRGVELQELRPEHGGHVGHAHGHALMPRLGPVHGVHGEHADGVGHFDGRDRHGGNPVAGGGRSASHRGPEGSRKVSVPTARRMAL